MKKILFTIILGIIFISCSENATKNTTDDMEVKNDINMILDDMEVTDEAIDCDEFIDKYEKFMDEYIDLIESYMNNPMDQENVDEYMNASQEFVDFSNQWMKFYSCAAQEKYQKQFDEISEKAEKKLEKYGI